MLRHAFQTALLHLNPLPKPSCQMRSPRLILPVCSSLAKMHLHSIIAWKACTTRLDPSHSWQLCRPLGISHEAAVCQMQVNMVSARWHTMEYLVTVLEGMPQEKRVLRGD